jgi:hypothetical protein
VCTQVLKIIKEGGKAHAVLDFVRKFLGPDAQRFTLRTIRSMIAEAEIAKLKLKHGFPVNAKI